MRVRGDARPAISCKDSCAARTAAMHITARPLAGRRVKDFRYYRCSGSDGYRFGGERVCSNTQVQGKFVETAVWQEVCDLLTNPQRLEREYQDRNMAGAALEHVQTLKAQRAKLERVLERLIDSFAGGLIEENQFTPRMERTKNRIADLDIRIKADAGDIDSLENLRLATKRLKELAIALGPDLANAEWHRKREIIRRLVQQIDIGQEIITIHFRVAQNARASDSISVRLSRR